MPRFFFNVYDDIVALDEEGQELPDAEAAKREAVRGVRSLASAQVLQGRLNVDHSVEVQDEDRRQVALIRFGEVVRVEDCLARSRN
jgi:hypothetical protein